VHDSAHLDFKDLAELAQHQAAFLDMGVFDTELLLGSEESSEKMQLIARSQQPIGGMLDVRNKKPPVAPKT